MVFEVEQDGRVKIVIEGARRYSRDEKKRSRQYVFLPSFVPEEHVSWHQVPPQTNC